MIYTDSVLHLDKLWTINQSVCSLCNNSTRHYSAPKAESKNFLLLIQTILLPHQLAMWMNIISSTIVLVCIPHKVKSRSRWKKLTIDEWSTSTVILIVWRHYGIMLVFSLKDTCRYIQLQTTKLTIKQTILISEHRCRLTSISFIYHREHFMTFYCVYTYYNEVFPNGNRRSTPKLKCTLS